MKLTVLPIVLAPLLAARSAILGEDGILDLYERFNRQVHAINKGVDRAVARPLGRVTSEAPAALPRPVANFSDNLGLPGAVVHNVLQGDLEGVFTNTARFAVNSTAGLLGLADPAGAIGLHEVETDFGETLAV